ncbi:hypothetical protein AXK11_05425 [Cephaloticoccus primus]|uniref:Transcriptional regulator LacI/GalR-like sensor domain-containing protein n=1 Tax=Cephaloticoccus primus TaxID=1548207 RepID=A0A139SMG9_9BACT|nr:hypothetical protein AXK11_05425 [Cephaloticoccus primus]
MHAAAAELGYSHNPLFAEVMRFVRQRAPDRHLGALAYLVPCRSNEQWEQARRLGRYGRYGAAVREHAARYGFDLTEFPIGLPAFSASRLAQILIARGISGLFLETFPNEHFEREFPWQHFSTLLVGHSLHSPGLDCVVSDHVNAVLLAGEQVLSRGYRRIGLALETSQDRDTSGAWVNGYQLLQARHPQWGAIPPFIRREITAGPLIAWLKEYGIDCVFTLSALHDGPLRDVVTPMEDWLAAAGIECPGEVGLVTLDRSYVPELPWAGIDQSTEEQGRAAVDLLLAKLQVGERGLPKISRTLLVHSHWCEGRTVRAPKL